MSNYDYTFAETIGYLMLFVPGAIIVGAVILFCALNARDWWRTVPPGQRRERVVDFFAGPAVFVALLLWVYAAAKLIRGEWP